MSGGWGFAAAPSHQTHTRLVASCVSAYTLENVTAQVPVVDLVIPGVTLGACGTLRLVAIAEYVNDTTAINCFSARVLFGTSCQVATLTTGSVVQSCERSWVRIQTDIVGAGATNTQRSFSRMDYPTTAATGAGTSRIGSTAISGHMGMAVDSTADQTARITIALSSVVGCVRFVFHSLHIERVAGN